MKKLYLSGPMSGLPDFNRPAFDAEAKRLRSLGYEVVSPAEMGADSQTYIELLKMDIAAMLHCDGIAMLPGWYMSRGANIEYQIARLLDFPCVDSSEIQEGVGA